MDKTRLKIALTLLDAVKVKYPETKQFIGNTKKDECQKEKISVEELTFFTSLEERVSSEKHFLFCSEYAKRYYIKLNSFGYNIYLHVI